MLAGEMGAVRQLALRHQSKVGEFFGAPDFVPGFDCDITSAFAFGARLELIPDQRFLRLRGPGD
jgi:hypothetical protein